MDALRITVIAGVIVLHAATAYLLDIDWYYQERTTSTLTSTLLTFPALLAGLFGLGPLFLLGGLLSAASLAGKGPGRFAHGRLVRLGSPLGAETFANLRWEAGLRGSACSPSACWRASGAGSRAWTGGWSAAAGG